VRAVRRISMASGARLAGSEEREDRHEGELGGEGLGGGDRSFDAGEGREIDSCLAGHGGLRDIRHCDGRVAAAGGFAERGKGIGGFTGLGEYEDG
jgi:hypothetical protein